MLQTLIFHLEIYFEQTNHNPTKDDLDVIRAHRPLHQQPPRSTMYDVGANEQVRIFLNLWYPYMLQMWPVFKVHCPWNFLLVNRHLPSCENRRQVSKVVGFHTRHFQIRHKETFSYPIILRRIPIFFSCQMKSIHESFVAKRGSAPWNYTQVTKVLYPFWTSRGWVVVTMDIDVYRASQATGLY